MVDWYDARNRAVQSPVVIDGILAPSDTGGARPRLIGKVLREVVAWSARGRGTICNSSYLVFRNRDVVEIAIRTHGDIYRICHRCEADRLPHEVARLVHRPVVQPPSAVVAEEVGTLILRWESGAVVDGSAHDRGSDTVVVGIGRCCHGRRALRQQGLADRECAECRLDQTAGLVALIAGPAVVVISGSRSDAIDLLPGIPAHIAHDYRAIGRHGEAERISQTKCQDFGRWIVGVTGPEGIRRDAFA